MESNYSLQNIKKLREIAKERGIKNHSEFTKENLVKILTGEKTNKSEKMELVLRNKVFMKDKVIRTSENSLSIVNLNNYDFLRNRLPFAHRIYYEYSRILREKKKGRKIITIIFSSVIGGSFNDRMVEKFNNSNIFNKIEMVTERLVFDWWWRLQKGNKLYFPNAGDLIMDVNIKITFNFVKKAKGRKRNTKYETNMLSKEMHGVSLY